MHSEHVKKSYAKFFKILFDSLPQKLLIFISFALFIFVTTYKITNASLWFDEGVEYLVSTKLFSQMISAINTTYQPPLYNFIMHLLLKISLSEYWFRLTSALFGIIGCLGLYFTLKELKGRIFACIGIFAYTFLRNVVYYNQECAEYSLLICCLLWFTYFFICLLKEFTISKCVLFVISGILSVYSQYGAVFPVAGLSISIILFYLLKKQYCNVKKLFVVMSSGVIFTGIPLYVIFMRHQMQMQSSGNVSPFNNLFHELSLFLDSLNVNFSFMFSSFYKSNFLLLLTSIVYLTFVSIVIWSAFQKKDNTVKFTGLAAIITYITYYAAIRIGLYSYGEPGGRYALALLPIFFICIYISIIYIFEKMFERLRISKFKKIRYLPVLLLLILMIAHNYNNWLIIMKNWQKEDVRSAMQIYMNETSGEEPIYIYYGAVPVFATYADIQGLDYGRENVDRWGTFGSGVDPLEVQYKQFYYGENLRGKDTAYMKKSILRSFSNNIPMEFWFLLSHIHADNLTYMQSFYDLGYGYQSIRWRDARLLKMFNTDYFNEHMSVIFSDHNMECVNAFENLELQYDDENGGVKLELSKDSRSKPHLTLSLFKNKDYTVVKPHMGYIELKSNQEGDIRVYYKTYEDNEFNDKNYVTVQFVGGNNRVYFELPEGALLEDLRLDINAEKNSAEINILEITIYEE